MGKTNLASSKIHIYASPDLKQWLAALAVKEHRTLSAQIVKMLSDYREEHETQPEKPKGG